jgi:transcriptional regulator with XRE-family HTH domain
VRIDPDHSARDRRYLAHALRALRRASGLSGERLALRCGMSQSKVSRIETGRALPTVADVQHMLSALEVDAETSAELLALAGVANAEYEDVRTSVRRGLHLRQQELAALDAQATHTRFFLPAIPTGLLQTPHYMRTAMNPPIDPAAGDTSRAVTDKLRRQTILHDENKRFDFLLTEQAVRWRLCPPAQMARQLDHLVTLSRSPSARLGVLPLTTEVHQAPFHTFTVYDDHLVTVELFSGRVVLRDPKDVAYYGALFDHFAGAACFGDQARDLIREWAQAFRAD